MEFEEILKKAKKEEITREEALFLLKKAQSYDKILELFKVASKVREDEVGPIFKLDGFIGVISRCISNPPCRYCWNSSTLSEIKSGLKDVLTSSEISQSAKLIEETGTNAVELGGASFTDEKSVIEAVKAFKDASNLNVWVKAGPGFSEEGLKELKKLEVDCIAVPLEVLKEELFRKVKPGDDLSERMEIIKTVDNLGIKLATVLICGLGEAYNDRVDHLFYLKQFKNFKYLAIVCFRPIPGTPMSNYPLISPLEGAVTGAIARLIFRDIDIHSGTYDQIPLCALSGGNRMVHAGASVVRRSGVWHALTFGAEVKQINERLDFLNLLPTAVKFITGAGMEVEPKIADKYEVI